MSELENKVERDQNGFFNCQLLCISTSQQCSRRYLTLVGFDNHVKLEHSHLNLKQNKENQDSNCVPNDVVYAKIPPKFQEDEELFLKKNLNSHQLEECKTLYGEKEVHKNIFSLQCQECKKSQTKNNSAAQNVFIKIESFLVSRIQQGHL